MSKFKAIAAEIEELSKSIPDIKKEIDVVSTMSVVSSSETSNLHVMVLQIRDKVKGIKERVESMKEEIEKVHAKALVTDEDKATYGEKMREKIKATYRLYQNLNEELLGAEERLQVFVS